MHTKFQADIIFGFHLITLKRCCPSDGSIVPTSGVSNRKSGCRYQTKYQPKPWENTETEPT